MLRLLVAAAGVAFILYVLNWRDTVALTGPIESVDGKLLVEKDEQVRYRVINGMAEALAADDKTVVHLLLVKADAGEGKPKQFEILYAPASEDAQRIELHPSVSRTIRLAASEHWPLLAAGLLMTGLIYPVQCFRWWMLMRARQLGVGYRQAFRLVMVGTFFNFCMPGMTGGDVIRAFYAAKRGERRTDAIITIFLDRMTGLIGLVLTAGLVGLLVLWHDTAKWVTIFVWAGMLLLTVLGGLYLSRSVRQVFPWHDWLIKLPGGGALRKVDDAVAVYRDHWREVVAAVLVSVPVHLTLALATALAGYALGMDAPLLLLMTVIPVVFLAGALPVSYMGFGLMELVALPLLGQGVGDVSITATGNQIVTMLLLIRIYQLVYSMIGAGLLVRGDIHLRDVREQMMDQENQSSEGAAGE